MELREIFYIAATLYFVVSTLLVFAVGFAVYRLYKKIVYMRDKTHEVREKVNKVIAVTKIGVLESLVSLLRKK